MKRNYNELAAVVYADLFGYPLTVAEAKLWAIRDGRQKNSETKMALAKKIVQDLKKIPTIQAIFLTGSVAVGNAKKDADIDLMIVTAPGTLWLTRLKIFWLLKKKGLYKQTVCPNIFLDTNHLEIQEKNLYTAHEILQAKCLYDGSNIEYSWIKNNSWTEDYLPKISKIRRTQSENHRINSVPRISKSILRFLVPFELAAYLFQYLYMKRKITNEKLGWGYAFFHPRQLGKSVEEKFNQRLVEYTGK